ncbi:MAG: hypothetical protein GY751_03995 [Bacteroidetes bacterium]|nr:hypothetical protein [Bacteroidota bacterium]
MKGRNQLLMGLKGSFENMTVTQARDGDAIVKGKITQMTNPNTEAQQGVRTVFSGTLELAKTLLPFIRQYFKPANVNRSAFNEFISWNCDVAKLEKDSGVKKDNEDKYYTHGSLYQAGIAHDAGSSVDNGDGTQQIAFSWNYDADSEIQEGTDVLKVLLVNAQTLDWKIVDGGATRADAAGSVGIANPASGNLVIAPFLVNAAGSNQTTQRAAVMVAPDGTVTTKFVA